MTVASVSLFDFYSFDTSAIINGRRDIFLPSTFGAVWDAIEKMVAAGDIAAVDEVKRELQRRSDDAFRWAKSCKSLFVPLDHDVQMATREVLAAHPRLIGISGSMRSAADPFVIGLALARGGTVVTEEHRANLKKPKIPDVCEAMGIPWLTLPHFVDKQGWALSLVSSG